MEEQGIKDTAIIRLEQLCPFPTKELQDEVSRYPHAKSKNAAQKFRIFLFFVKSYYVHKIRTILPHFQRKNYKMMFHVTLTCAKSKKTGQSRLKSEKKIAMLVRLIG